MGTVGVCTALLTAGSAGAVDEAFVSQWQGFALSVNADVHLDIK